MEKIKKYVERFFRKVRINAAYDLPGKEYDILSDRARINPIDATGTAFLFGYAKGYRAAMAEMRKGGMA